MEVVFVVVSKFNDVPSGFGLAFDHCPLSLMTVCE
jgi:hypothetical protein